MYRRRIGGGRFNAEVWVMTGLGLNFDDSSKADLETTRFLFSALAPFVLLVLLSFVTPLVRREVLDRFFAKYVSINSFTETAVRSVNRGEVIRWPVRIGRRQAL